MLVIALFFVWRSFYAMRIKTEEGEPARPAHGSPTVAKAHA